MSIFTNITPSITSTIPSLTLEQKKSNVSRNIVSMGQRHYTQLCRIQKEGIDTMWYNKDLTPQEVADAVGVNAGVLITAHGALTIAIATAAAAAGIQPDIKLPTNTFTVNADGTVTISNDPYVA